MTRIEPLTIAPYSTTLRRTATAAILGAVCGFSAAISVMQYIEPAYADSDRIMEAACRLGPEIGAYAWQHRKPEGVECGRYK